MPSERTERQRIADHAARMVRILRESAFLDVLPMLCATADAARAGPYMTWRLNGMNYYITNTDLLADAYAANWPGMVAYYLRETLRGTRPALSPSEAADDFICAHSYGAFPTVDALRKALEKTDEPRDS